MKKVSRRAYGRIGRTRNVPDFSKESHAQSIVQVSEEDFARSLEDIVDKKGLFNAVQDELDEIALIGTLRLKQKELKEIAVRIRNILGMLPGLLLRNAKKRIPSARSFPTCLKSSPARMLRKPWRKPWTKKDCMTLLWASRTRS